jgi:23S rRNA G2445 N2-methylase RlmL
LDPAVGVCAFPLVLYTKLLDRLKDVIPDLQDRELYIIENMLFMIDINPKYVSTTRSNFGRLFKGLKINVVQADFLTRFTHENWPQSFGVIITNPPYNYNGIRTNG